MVLIEGAAVAAGVAAVLPLARVLWKRWVSTDEMHGQDTNTAAKSGGKLEEMGNDMHSEKRQNDGTTMKKRNSPTLQVDAEFILNALAQSSVTQSSNSLNVQGSSSSVAPELAEEANREIALLEAMRNAAKMKTSDQLIEMMFQAAETRDIVALIAALDVADQWGLCAKPTNTETEKEPYDGSTFGKQRKKRLRSDVSNRFVNSQRTEDGWTPLHIVTAPRPLNDVNAKTELPTTDAELKYQSLATLLLRQRGADTMIADWRGRTVHDVAVRDGMVQRALGIAPDQVVVVKRGPDQDREFVEEMDKILGL